MSRLADHQLQFYDDESVLCDRVAEYLLEGLARDQSLLIVGTPGHTAGFLDRMRLAGVNPDALLSARRLAIADARGTLNQILINGWPDESRLRSVVGAAIGLLRQRRPDTPVRIYGEMVNLLAADGQIDAAIALEDCWCSLVAEGELSLLCGYDMSFLDTHATAEQFEKICARHNQGRGLEAELQHRRMLEQSLQEATYKLQQQLEGLSRLSETAARVAHLARELRNPLAQVQSALAIIRDPEGDANDRRFAADAIDRQMWQMTHLIDDLRDVAQLASTALSQPVTQPVSASRLAGSVPEKLEPGS
jgi:signal transduction histidine kinase